MFFASSDYQFGFKKELSCSHVVYTVRSIVEHYVENGSTVQVCSIDLSKAFDKMNHYALMIKLIDKQLPLCLLKIIANWFSISVTAVKWCDCYSRFISLLAGVRQGGVLSPVLFCVFIDNLVNIVKSTNVGCYISSAFAGILLYADDIMLLAPTVTALQIMLVACELELKSIGMQINVQKSACMRFGYRYDSPCSSIISLSGNTLKWVTSFKYLGIVIVSGKRFRCLFDACKKKFFGSFNAIFGRVGRLASEDVILHLTRTKCLPVLLYAIEACPLLSRDIHSLEFVINRCLMKLFKTSSLTIVNECCDFFGFTPIRLTIETRTVKFLERYISSENIVCSCFVRIATAQLNGLLLATANRPSL